MANTSHSVRTGHAHSGVAETEQSEQTQISRFNVLLNVLQPPPQAGPLIQ